MKFEQELLSAMVDGMAAAPKLTKTAITQILEGDTPDLDISAVDGVVSKAVAQSQSDLEVVRKSHLDAGQPVLDELTEQGGIDAMVNPELTALMDIDLGKEFDAELQAFNERVDELTVEELRNEFRGDK